MNRALFSHPKHLSSTIEIFRGFENRIGNLWCKCLTVRNNKAVDYLSHFNRRVLFQKVHVPEIDFGILDSRISGSFSESRPIFKRKREKGPTFLVKKCVELTVI
jgi:hypothetical protein